MINWELDQYYDMMHMNDMIYNSVDLLMVEMNLNPDFSEGFDIENFMELQANLETNTDFNVWSYHIIIYVINSFYAAYVMLDF